MVTATRRHEFRRVHCNEPSGKPRFAIDASSSHGCIDDVGTLDDKRRSIAQRSRVLTVICAQLFVLRRQLTADIAACRI
jgi:hypothetical protein